mmetsp:Transcript_400/g.1219  ORF Transcript_400/g.1219 Transcript_400/m.1219 type:complete len:96 (-) Transcript_400:1295-1582(-)
MNQEGVGDQTTSSKALTGGRHTHTHERERERERLIETETDWQAFRGAVQTERKEVEVHARGGATGLVAAGEGGAGRASEGGRETALQRWHSFPSE